MGDDLWDIKHFIIEDIKKNPSYPKSKILTQIKKRVWKGYKSSEFVVWSIWVDRAMKELISDGSVIFERGKPLRLKEGAE